MRVLILFIMILAFSSCSDKETCPQEPQQPPWALRDDKMNFAVFLIDFETNTFIGANLAYYELCDGCDTERLPIWLSWDRYEEGALMAWWYGNEIVFSGDFSKVGIASITYPDSLLAPSQFRAIRKPVLLPANAEYLVKACQDLTGEECQSRAKQAWDAIADLDIVAAFAQRQYRVGFYRHNRGILSEESISTWVIFLYAGRTSEG